MDNLKNKVVNGIFWLISLNLIVQFLRLASKVVLARLLVPSDFGIIAIVGVIIAALSLFQTFWINASLIYRQRNIKEALDTAFFIALIISLFLTATGYLTAPLVSTFFKNSLIKPILRILSFTLIISSFGILPQTIIDKQLLFKKRILPEAGSMLIFGLISVALAFLGLGVWSIVLGQLASSISNTALYLIVSPFRPSFKFKWIAAKELLGYGYYAISINILIFLINHVDNVVVGKMLGSAQLGFYALAYTIANLTATEITHIISKVTFPAYSLLQNNKEALKKAYLKILTYTSLFSIPAAIGLLVLAPEITTILFGVKWTPMIPALIILSLYGMIRSISATTGPIFYALGKPNILKNLALIGFLIICIIIYPLTIKYGIFGTSIAILTPSILIQFLAFYKISKLIEVKCYVLWKALAFPFVISSIIAGLIFIIKSLIRTSLLNLLALICLSILFYFMAILLKPGLFNEIKNLTKLKKVI